MTLGTLIGDLSADLRGDVGACVIALVVRGLMDCEDGVGPMPWRGWAVA